MTDGSGQATLLVSRCVVTPVALGRIPVWYATGRKPLARLTCWPQQYLLGSRLRGTFRPIVADEATVFPFSTYSSSFGNLSLLPACVRARARASEFVTSPAGPRLGTSASGAGRRCRKEGTPQSGAFALNLEERDASQRLNGEEGRQAEKLTGQPLSADSWTAVGPRHRIVCKYLAETSSRGLLSARRSPLLEEARGSTPRADFSGSYPGMKFAYLYVARIR